MSSQYKPPFLESRIKQLIGGSAYNHSDFERILSFPQVNYSLGAVVGGWIGDTLGSYCEFEQSLVSENKLNQAMQMNGGGPFYILPGQFTDDSQMSVALLEGLNSFNGENQSIEEQKWQILSGIGKEYVQWLQSIPFDVGMTCQAGINHIRRKSNSSNGGWNREKFDQLFSQLHSLNGNKQSNGSLMRISPMAVFYSLYQGDKEQLDELIKGEIQLTHPNKRLIEAGQDWIYLNNLLINRREEERLQTLYERYLSYHKSKPATLIEEYIEQGLKDELMNGVHKMGWAKIAFSYSLNQFRHMAQMEQKLQQNFIQDTSDVLYKEVIRKVMRQGGDTDTNCAIVGSLVGSIVGFKGLPEEYVNKVMGLNLPPASRSVSTTWTRPHIYEPRNAFLSLLKLVGKLNPKYRIV